MYKIYLIFVIVTYVNATKSNPSVYQACALWTRVTPHDGEISNHRERNTRERMLELESVYIYVSSYGLAVHAWMLCCDEHSLFPVNIIIASVGLHW